ncbi:auxin-responsive protein IAA4 isoform X3 [Phoenix dactylifera]|uniref:Auxin-responsive protein n=1 Tax=Phoenix dactylifera TaxID=42345 RepID=A0A8B7CJ84_PHODC|nr:auxin-responsive protein IAA4 isoform X3 [Phoenix dactylifera]
MGRGKESSPSSSIDSSSHPALSTASSLSQPRRDLSTDLRLGLSLSTSSPQDSSSSARGQLSDWPPIKPLLRSTLTEKGRQIQRQSATFFVKVYMEGIPIGRKLDLLALDGYDGLITTLRRMFRTSIMCPDIARVPTNNKDHVLTYEDKEGDWMMVGDVPWEMFLTTVKRMKIARADKC